MLEETPESLRPSPLERDYLDVASSIKRAMRTEGFQYKDVVDYEDKGRGGRYYINDEGGRVANELMKGSLEETSFDYRDLMVRFQNALNFMKTGNVSQEEREPLEKIVRSAIARTRYQALVILDKHTIGLTREERERRKAQVRAIPESKKNCFYGLTESEWQQAKGFKQVLLEKEGGIAKEREIIKVIKEKNEQELEQIAKIVVQIDEKTGRDKRSLREVLKKAVAPVVGLLRNITPAAMTERLKNWWSLLRESIYKNVARTGFQRSRLPGKVMGRREFLRGFGAVAAGVAAGGIGAELLRTMGGRIGEAPKPAMEASGAEKVTKAVPHKEAKGGLPEVPAAPLAKGKEQEEPGEIAKPVPQESGPPEAKPEPIRQQFKEWESFLTFINPEDKKLQSIDLSKIPTLSLEDKTTFSDSSRVSGLELERRISELPEVQEFLLTYNKPIKLFTEGGGELDWMYDINSTLLVKKIETVTKMIRLKDSEGNLRIIRVEEKWAILPNLLDPKLGGTLRCAMFDYDKIYTFSSSDKEVCGKIQVRNLTEPIEPEQSLIGTKDPESNWYIVSVGATHGVTWGENKKINIEVFFREMNKDGTIKVEENTTFTDSTGGINENHVLGGAYIGKKTVMVLGGGGCAALGAFSRSLLPLGVLIKDYGRFTQWIKDLRSLAHAHREVSYLQNPAGLELEKKGVNSGGGMDVALFINPNGTPLRDIVTPPLPFTVRVRGELIKAGERQDSPFALPEENVAVVRVLSPKMPEVKPVMTTFVKRNKEGEVIATRKFVVNPKTGVAIDWLDQWENGGSTTEIKPRKFEPSLFT